MKKITWKEFKTMWLESFHIAMHGLKVNMVATLLGLWTISLIAYEWLKKKCIRHKFILSVVVAIISFVTCIYLYVNGKCARNAYEKRIFGLTQKIDSLKSNSLVQDSFNEGLKKGNEIAVQALSKK